MAHDVFLSHSVKDKTVAEAIVGRLESASVTCWMAPRDVVPGADWGESIINAIESSRIMVLIFPKARTPRPKSSAKSSAQLTRGFTSFRSGWKTSRPQRHWNILFLPRNGWTPSHRPWNDIWTP
jgi:hypothetical protein